MKTNFLARLGVRCGDRLSRLFGGRPLSKDEIETQAQGAMKSIQTMSLVILALFVALWVWGTFIAHH